MPRKTDKRIRLIEAAKVLIHQQGFNLTTLADIAQEADVPLGNVYYYFKTKEAIGEAVIEKRAAEYAEMLARLDEIQDPASRLRAFVDTSVEELELIARSTIWLAKKKYVLNTTWKDPGIFQKSLSKIKFKGIEVVQSSTPLFSRNKIVDLIKYMLDPEANFDTVKKSYNILFPSFHIPKAPK